MWFELHEIFVSTIEVNDYKILDYYYYKFLDSLKSICECV